MSTLGSLKPTLLWKHFEMICSIAHPSGKEDKLREAIVGWAKELKLKYIVDEVGNIIISKPATPGKENCKGIILQGHIDMVPQKNNDTKHNFDTDPIIPYIDGEWVKAKGTTLGADNGIGVAAAMAILESKDIEHGPIECLFTIDEETGMTGAFGLKKGVLNGSILMNLDSEDEGELFIGCAGGVNTSAAFQCQLERVPKYFTAFDIKITGLKGGHSGLDINLGRGNANKIMNRILWYATRKFGIRLAALNGGSLRNAIPRESNATIAVTEKEKDNIIQFVEQLAITIKKELSTTEPNLQIAIEHNEILPESIIDQKSQDKFLSAIYACPNGVMGMSADMPGLVETSTNLAIVKLENDIIQVHTLQRSSVTSQMDDVANMLECTFEHSAAVKQSGRYPGWKPNVNSEILKHMINVYKNLYGVEPKVQAIHAGLECGLFGDVYENWDMISFGPTIRNPHSPDERVNIASVDKFWNYLVTALKNAPTK